METLLTQSQAERIKVKLGFDGHFCVNRNGRAGGLLLLWIRKDTVNLISYSQNHIDVGVKLPDKEQWRLTGWYGFPERSRRQDAWNFLKLLRHKSSLPWLVIGDFNDLAWQFEKRGHVPHPHSLLSGFRDTLSECNLWDLGMNGYAFTWERGRGTQNWVEERLDRAVGCPIWREVYSTTIVNNILVSSSDHSALFLEVHGSPQAWQEGDHLSLQGKLCLCASKLTSWGGEKFHQFSKLISSYKRRLEQLKPRCDMDSIAEFNVVHRKLNQLLNQEEIYWKQRSKQFWLKEGDRNTRFFHRYASVRERKNYIPFLTDSTGSKIEGDSMREMIVDYFKDVFQSRGTQVDNIFHDVQQKVTVDQNNMLL